MKFNSSRLFSEIIFFFKNRCISVSSRYSVAGTDTSWMPITQERQIINNYSYLSALSSAGGLNVKSLSDDWEGGREDDVMSVEEDEDTVSPTGDSVNPTQEVGI